ncbi:MAG: hypothetical protein Q8927_20515 [Bacteroidota bacterium]|nr:hypothetical protein [Bacteroidota bacterium]MDP4218589.1 hypothetical protein [Bacteroidota bacterium]MDP4246964.1 hypothetical protein [Bacteroidota bacterium]MDP4254471.1 hypothetical protein [Bacteroidota bacterium]MDP4260020.1 hypothetical protein [Bacteroidota bacterium]
MDKQTDHSEDDFSPQESLLFIQTMIEKARDSVADKSFYFLLWGWLVFAAALGQFFIKVILKSDWHPIVWTLMIVGAIASIFRGRKEHGHLKVRSYVDESLAIMWIAIGITQGMLIFVFSRQGDWQDCYTFFILLYSLGCFVTGRILKFSPLVWGAAAGWLLAIVTTYATYDYNILVMALAILVSYIIPGYLLRKEHREKQHV